MTETKNMELQIIIRIVVLTLTSCVIFGVSSSIQSPAVTLANIAQPDKDMYVIHATVYEVGILTNRTDNETDKYNSTGNLESITLCHTNGTNVDLSAIPAPILTNVTAQSLVGVAPITDTDGHDKSRIWEPLNQLTYPAVLPLGNANAPVVNDEKSTTNSNSTNKWIFDNSALQLSKRDVQSNIPVKVVNGTIVIPPEAGAQFISLPPLLSFNNNLPEIPVPIPNTSVVHYATVNTLVQKP